jgi:excisionase family DNA binding protein
MNGVHTLKNIPVLVGIYETATLLGIGRTKVYDLISTNRLVTIKIGKRRLVRRDSINTLVDDLTRQKPSHPV